MRHSIPLSLLALTLALPARAETVKRSLCVFDISGESGDYYKTAIPYALAALDWGVDFGHPQVRQDEKIAAEDFRAEKCDVVVMTGVRARQFVLGAGTIEAIGAVQNYKQLKVVADAIARPSEAALMKDGVFESGGFFPAGAVYLVEHDRSITTATQLAGKRIAVLDYDGPSNRLSQRVGAAAVTADSSTFSGMFNSGGVNVAYTPITAYAPLELNRGVGKTGGIVRFPLAQLTFQMVFRTARMPEGFGQASRKYLAGQFDSILSGVVERCERDVRPSQWLEIPNKTSYDTLFQNLRVDLAKEHLYDKTMLHKLMLVRCREDPARAECAEKGVAQMAASNSPIMVPMKATRDELMAWKGKFEAIHLADQLEAVRQGPRPEWSIRTSLSLIEAARLAGRIGDRTVGRSADETAVELRWLRLHAATR